jgi:hypothetical protein
VTPLARVLLAAVVGDGPATGLGPTFVKYSATGTTTMPMSTVSTKVTAPHSRRTKAQLTSGEF